MRKNKLIILLLSLCFTLEMMPQTVRADETESTETVKIYMAPISEKKGTGTEKAPFTSFEEVGEYIKQYKAKNKTPKEIQVILRGGDYCINKTITLGEDFGGYDEEHKVIFKAYEGETPRLKGAKEIDKKNFKKVEDKKILSKFTAEARDKIGVVNLREQGFSDEKIKPHASNYARLYFDGNEQLLSQWPNGDYNWARYKPIVKGSSTDGGTFQYLDTVEPAKWLDAPDMFVNGFWAQEYEALRYEIANIDTDRKTIKLKKGAVSLQGSRRWQAYNALELIDKPGEWYLDRTNMLLYYYPQYGMNGKKLEFANFTGNLFEFKGAQNVAFEGLTFEMFRGNIFNCEHSENNPIKNITIDKCDFYNTATVVNFYTYSYLGVWDHADWVYREGMCRNIKITNNIFFNLSGVPISIYGGGYKNFEDCGVLVENNYSNQIASLNLTERALGIVQGYKPVMKNNLIHNSPQAVGGTGASWESDFAYNEVVSVLKETADAGAFYAGRTAMARNNRIRYNMFLEMRPAAEFLKDHQYCFGIYYDDGFAGGIIENNIIYGALAGIKSSGSGTSYKNNTFVDCKLSFNLITSPMLAQLYPKFFEEANLSNSVTKEILKRYPEMEAEYKKLEENDYKASVNNVVEGNLTVNTQNPESGQGALYLQYNTYKNNIGADESVFVDAKNHDYRLKKGSDAAKKNSELITEDFDISKIGIQWDNGFDKERILNNRSFRKIYPKNGQTSVKTKNVEFMWQRAFDADEYRFVLATDKNFENIVEEKIVPYNWCTVENLEANYTDYYWKVYAKNNTVSLKGEWESNGVTYRFTTTKYEFLDFDVLEKAIEKVNKDMRSIKDGEEGGTFKPGTEARIEAVMKKAQEALSWKSGERKQQEIEDIANELLNSYSDDDINSGYYNLGKDFAEKEKWSIRNEENTNIKFESDGTLHISTLADDGTPLKSFLIENSSMSMASTKILFAFSMKANWGGATPWIGLGIRGTQELVDLWNCDNYFFAIKPDIIEIQLKSAGKSGIMEIIPNDCIREDEWHDIVFGAYDCGFGQMMVLYVDGKLIKRFMDSDPDQIKQKGNLKIYMSTPGSLSLRPIQKEPEQDFEEMVEKSVREETLNLAKKTEEYCGEKAIVLVSGTNGYYKDGKLTECGGKIYEITDDNEMISADVIADIFGVEVKKETNMVTVDINGKQAIFVKGDKIVGFGNEKFDSGIEVYEENGTIFIPMKTLTQFIGKTTSSYEGVTTITTRYVELINNKNIVTAVKGAFEKLMEITVK